jgi:HEAT repeat protein
MKYARTLCIAMTCLLGAAAAWAAEEKSLKQQLEELLPGMGAEKLGDRNGPQQQWQGICFQAGVPGNEAQRLEVCKLMAEKLGPQTAAPARVWLLWQLEFIGRGECVDAVAAALDDADELVHDAARRALTNNPAPEATAKLIAKLAAAKDARFKAGLLNSLGCRDDKAGAAAAIKELGNSDAAIASAAAGALGKIATPEAVQALAAARAKAPGELRLRFGDAYLACADKLLKQNKAAEAAVIYRELSKPGEPKPLRMAALRGTILAAGDQGGKPVAEMLTGDDALARTIATSQITTLNAAAVKELAAGMAKFPAASQTLVLESLAARGDKSTMPTALAAAKSDDAAVKQAGLSALGRLGDVSVVPLLIETALAGGPSAEAARHSLECVVGAGVDEKVIDAMKAAKDLGRRATLIEILERRSAVSAVPALLLEALSDDGNVRRRAISALGRLADSKDVPGMVKALLKSEKGGERDDAERAIALVCGRVTEEEKRAEPVLAALAGAAEADKPALLPVLGRIGGKRALDAAKAALAANNAEMYEAGVRAIGNWPDATIADAMLELAQNGKEAKHRIAALRAFARVIAQPSERPNAEKLALLKKGMELAARDEERNLLLDRAAAIREVATLKFVAPFLDNPALAERAGRTVVELASRKDLRPHDKAAFAAALDKVIAVCKDRDTVDRAKRYKQGE